MQMRGTAAAAAAQEGSWHSEAKLLTARRSESFATRRSDSIMSIEEAIQAACRYEAQGQLERPLPTREEEFFKAVGQDDLSMAADEGVADAVATRGRRAFAELREARRTGDSERMEEACRRAEEAGLPPSDIERARAEARRAHAFKELLEAREKGSAKCIEMACKSAETAGLTRTEVAALRTRFQQLCLTRIEEACRRAETMGVDAADIVEARAQARGLRSEVRKLQVAAELLEARMSGNATSIREACRRAEEAGLTPAGIEALQRKLARLYATCIEEACRRAQDAGVSSAEIDEARAEAAQMRASAELVGAKRGCFSFSGVDVVRPWLGVH